MYATKLVRSDDIADTKYCSLWHDKIPRSLLKGRMCQEYDGNSLERSVKGRTNDMQV